MADNSQTTRVDATWTTGGCGNTGDRWIAPRAYDQYGEVTPEGCLLRDILSELRTIRAFLENQHER